VSLTIKSESLDIPVAGVMLKADLSMPVSAQGVVLFAHGGGSSRFSPRNRLVADELQGAGLATVLADLLTDDEERSDTRTGQLRFDIDLLAGRVIALVDWLAEQELGTGLDIGLFGASTGAAAALIAAALRPRSVGAVVSRGGRPDLAREHLQRVRQPSLLIVGGTDDVVLELNRKAMALIRGETRLEIIPGAGHLFEEPGALRRVAHLARDWFLGHLTRPNVV
jgi:putative phosphoribosyl transferase